MNPIDIAALAILALCVLFGLYRGFVQSVLSLAGGLMSVVGSFWLFPKLSDVLSANTSITRAISTYTDSGRLLGDLGLSSMQVDALGADSIRAIVQKASLPAPLDTLLSHNLQQRVFAPLGDLAATVGDYVNQTILSMAVNVLCFLLCYLLCFLLCKLVINLIRAVFRFPVLKHFDALLGGVFGLLLGVVLCFVVFTLLPLLQSVAPPELLSPLVENSALGKLFENGSFVVSIMNRKL